MVHKALEIGVKPAARLFQTFPSVVRKWIKRFKTEGYRGLADRSHKPHHSPRETPKYMKEQLVALKGKYKRLGAEQVRVLENLSQAPQTMRKNWREGGLPARKKTKKKKLARSKKTFSTLRTFDGGYQRSARHPGILPPGQDSQPAKGSVHLSGGVLRHSLHRLCQ